MASKTIPWNAEAGQRVKQARKNMQWAQGQLCEAARIRRNMLIAIENGSRAPQQDRLKQIAKALGVNAEWLIYGDKNVNEPDVVDVASSVVEETPAVTALFPGDNVGARLKYARNKAGITLKLIAEASDIGVSYLSIRNYESGKHRVPFSRLQIFAREYGCEVENLATQEEIEALKAYETKYRKMLTQAKKAGDARKKRKEPASIIPADTEQPKEPVGEPAGVESICVHPVPVAVPAVPDAVSLSARKIGHLFKTFREQKGILEEEMATLAGLPVEKYREFEQDSADITMREYLTLCKVAHKNPETLLAEAQTARWITFTSTDRLEVYGCLGLCVDHKIEHINMAGEGTIMAYCDEEYFYRLLHNIGIRI